MLILPFSDEKRLFFSVRFHFLGLAKTEKRKPWNAEVNDWEVKKMRLGKIH